MLLSERRNRFREILAGTECVHPGSVYDPMTARMAESLGFTIGMFAGSVASATVLGAPDIVVLTLSELAEQVKRISRAGNLSILVDADHGFGNALSVMRTVEELEIAGASGLTIEDTLLPRPFGATQDELISADELVGKLKAGLAARRDPSLVIVGRTGALRYGGVSEACARAARIQEAGADALFLTGVTALDQLSAVHQATALPLIIGGAPPDLADARELATVGVRVALQGHHPFYASVKAAYDALKHLREGGAPAALADRVASRELLEISQAQGDYQRWQDEYLT